MTSDNSTFFEWSSDFSAGESTTAAVEDARFKRKEAFAVEIQVTGGRERDGGVEWKGGRNTLRVFDDIDGKPNNKFRLSLCLQHNFHRKSGLQKMRIET